MLSSHIESKKHRSIMKAITNELLIKILETFVIEPMAISAFVSSCKAASLSCPKITIPFLTQSVRDVTLWHIEHIQIDPEHGVCRDLRDVEQYLMNRRYTTYDFRGLELCLNNAIQKRYRAIAAAERAAGAGSDVDSDDDDDQGGEVAGGDRHAQTKHCAKRMVRDLNDWVPNSLSELVQTWPSGVEVLRILHNKSRTDIKDVSFIQSLRVLEIFNCGPLRNFANCIMRSTSLEDIRIIDTPLSEGDLRAMSHCPSLKFISIGGLNPIGKITLSVFSSASIEKLSIHNVRLGDLDFSEQCTSLHTLSMHNMRSSSFTNVNTIGRLPALTSLELRDCGFLCDVSDIANAKKLGTLDISHSYRIKDFSWMRQAPQIHTLITTSQRTDCFDKMVEISQCNTLRSLSMDHWGDVENLDGLHDSLPHLHELSLCTWRSLRTIDALSNAHHLRKLSLSGCTWIQSITPLHNLEHIEDLNITKCRGLLKTCFFTITHLASLSLKKLLMTPYSWSDLSLKIVAFLEDCPRDIELIFS